MAAARKFRIFERDVEINGPGGWMDPGLDRLRLYNLHYFNDLVAQDRESRSLWHESLIHDWIDENPPGRGIGWEPYPVSLRTANFIKWGLMGGHLSERALDSLATQVRYLCKSIETGHQGNHLLANAKALIFAGAYFQGSEARSWLTEGARIFFEGLNAQILSDGGHFERSPMYHSLVLEDILDILNLRKAFPEAFYESPVLLEVTAKEMHRWLKAMTHPDGEISLFSDAAFGVGFPVALLEDYGERIGLEFDRSDPGDGIVSMISSGYVRLRLKDITVIADGGPIGPDRVPGHGHADTLSFELSCSGCRMIVDTGTSLYGEGEERLRQRGTSAHNTVVVDGCSSSEVWSNFRVGRRARTFGLSTSRTDEGLLFTCGHNGYRRLKGSPVHVRSFTLSDNELRIEDSIEGSGRHRLEAFLHLHPSVSVMESGGGFTLAHPELDRQLHVSFGAGEAGVEPGTYHSRFGQSEPARTIVLRKDGPLPIRLTTIIRTTT